MFNYDDVVKILYNKLYYEQRLISIIDDSARQIIINNPIELQQYNNSTIKIEGMERYSNSMWNACNLLSKKYAHFGPITCHVFIAKENSISFPLHTDPDDVIIHCLAGTKKLEINGKKVILNPKQEVYIKANTPHKAINETSSIILSFGLEKFLIDKDKNYELDVLFENN